MSAFRVIQISDTHLSRAAPWFVPNFEAMVGIVSAERPDLVVNAGDISLDGAIREDDLVAARSCHAALDVPFRAVPGNHDLGDNPWRPEVAPAIDGERRLQYLRHFGEDFWLVDTGPWVLVGINAQLFGSGLASEAEQWMFLGAVPAQADGRSVALFTHKPLFDRVRPRRTSINASFRPITVGGCWRRFATPTWASWQAGTSTSTVAGGSTTSSTAGRHRSRTSSRTGASRALARSGWGTSITGSTSGAWTSRSWKRPS